MPDPISKDLFVTREGVKVEVGQVWGDLDKRMVGRRVVVVSLGNMTFSGKVRIRNAATPRGVLRWLSVDRMHRHSTGFALVPAGK